MYADSDSGVILDEDKCQGMTLQLAEKWTVRIDLCQGMTLQLAEK